MPKTCVQCSAAFTITDEDRQMLTRLSPTIGGKTFALPEPTLCPDCRQQRRLAFRNERRLYKRSCDLCEKDIISMYHKDCAFPVYCPQCWWSDKWDPFAFGREVDFEKSLFQQIYELEKDVPHLGLHVVSNEDAEYVSLSAYNKRCYLIVAAEYNEDCLYGTQVIKSESCVDTLNCLESKYCYEVLDVTGCYELFYSERCHHCSESFFLSECRSCSHCLFCTNLRNKQYYIFNEPCTPEVFAEKKKKLLEDLQQGKLPELRRTFLDFQKQSVHRNLNIQNSEESIGDFLSRCKNAQQCFDLAYGEDCRYVLTGFQAKDLMDVCHTTEFELGYDSHSIGYHSYNVLFTNGAWTSHDIFYSHIVHNSHNLFASIGLRNAQYCILNRQYTKEEYETLVPKIITHMSTERRSASGGQNPPQSPFHKGGRRAEWGEFFPIELSPFAYNETVAQEYFPLRKEDLPGFKNLAGLGSIKWRDEEDKIPQVSKKIPAEKLPDNINDIPDDILNWAIICQRSKRPYLIQKPELAFYRKMGLPIPRLHPDERHKDRMAKRNPRKLWKRHCGECGKNIETTYAPERPEKVLCERCYQEAVY